MSVATASAPARVGRAIPWYLWCASLAVTSAYIGGYWDISWHRSIGRDAFWSPPHIAIYACGVLAAISSGYLILVSTLRLSTPLPATESLRDASVRIWGLRGPLGAFIAAWGGAAMLASAPFDDWWHNAYGLDVRIVSPPHMVLAAGFFGIEFGTVLLIASFLNRAAAQERQALRRLLLYVGGTVVAESLLLKLEYINRSDMHSALFYIVVAIGTPAVLTALGLVSSGRWACTTMALVYSTFGLAFLWMLPLVPAEPKLGPVYQPVTHFIPWEFPLLVVGPALAIDLILPRTATWRPILRALALGVAYLGVFIALQWPFADFLMSPRARNYFFGTAYMDFSTPARSFYARFLFAPRETPPQFWRGMAIAMTISCAMAWIGLRLGGALRKVKR